MHVAKPYTSTITQILECMVEPSTGAVVLTSRKNKRKQKRLQSIGLITPPASDAETPSKKTQEIIIQPSPARLSNTSMSDRLVKTAQTFSLLVCSLGNPGASYANTLHSAGHTIISHISSVKLYRPFEKGLGGLVSRPNNMTYSFSPIKGFRKDADGDAPLEDVWTFWQSTSLMNVSGAGVRNAWKQFSKDAKAKGQESRLVVIHDELEAPLGNVAIKDGKQSPKGHNGLKSCQQSLGSEKWWRIGVGIGRPESREPDVVSRYVLKKMNGKEAKAMENACVHVVAALRLIEEGRR